MPQPKLSRARIAAAFARANEEGRIALIPYVMAGYPDAGDERGAGAWRSARRARTSWSWACRSPTRWPTARPSRRRASARWSRAMTLAGALALAGRIQRGSRHRSC